ncbi:dihydroxyacetone phosphate acyltransferase [Galleria mellonella]|uniref:Dihydroxyacetone phosphate acyltransferase n=1 Tax=Galleria mellonella TaxID=7137 RepID=A0ABM3MYS8_GALME|nr:dihydroxyacetone phosphate acyltransferase [Galleria mellonella]
MKMSEVVEFRDILLARKMESGIFQFMTRAWHPLRTFNMDKYYSPQELKGMVLDSVYLDSFIEAETARNGGCKVKLKKEVMNYLEEMCLDKKMHVIRWMGIAFLKISFMMKIGIFVNEPAVLKLRSSMKTNPILFLPTHRSYADFCLMTYLCYHYDIDLPAVAAGMDFYSMAVVGKAMRETGAFYIRRTLAGDHLYAATLKQYVRTLVSKYPSPIEFFLEGTRSRSNKSLPPKYGMLSMSLVPLFAREVSDITIVPVNLSYDRLMEHGLFAYEHVGVPKPKESTGGLLKSLYSLNDHYGNIYINIGTPLSVKSYLNNIPNTNEMLKPVDLQQLTPEQFKQVQSVANRVIILQQKCTVATISNLLALVLMSSLIENRLLSLDEVLSQVEWMITVLRTLGATVFENDVRGNVNRILVVHSKMVKLDKERRLRLLSGTLMDVSRDVQKKMKGHILKAETMATAIPIIQLQLYVNPILHYLVPPAIVLLIVLRRPITKDELSSDYHQIRKLLRHEFFHIEETEEKTLAESIDYCIQNNIIASVDGQLVPGSDERLQFLLKWSIWPALTTLSLAADITTEQVNCGHKQALKLVQERAERSGCHPYCLSLESIGNCLQGLVLGRALIKQKDTADTIYQLSPEVMEKCQHLINTVQPKFKVAFDVSNSVILDNTHVLCRL